MPQPSRSDPRRAAPRFKAFIATHARCGDHDVRTHVLDIAQGGARLHTGRRLRVAERATIRLGDRDVIGTVVWSRDSKSGLRFDVPLSSAEVMRIVETV